MARRLLLLTLILLVGCSQAGRRLDLGADTDLRKLRSRPPTGLRIGLLPIQHDPDADTEASDAQRMMAASLPDAFRNELLPLLRETSGFSIVPLKTGANRAQSFLEARNEGCHILARIDLTRYRHRYASINGWYWPNLFLWWYFWVPSFWVADEMYQTEFEGEIVFHSVNSERELARVPMRDSTTLALDDFDRGWSWWGVFWPPSGIARDHWEAIDESLRPAALSLLKKRIATGIGETFRNWVEENDDYKRLSRSVHALVIGVSRYEEESLFRRPEGARADAAAIVNVLRKRGIPPKNIDRLLDEQATRDRIRDRLRSLRVRAQSGDDLLFYFAGAGTTARRPSGSEAVILPHDGRPSGPARLPLSEVRDAMSRRRTSGRTIFILDCAFWGERDASPGRVAFEEAETPRPPSLASLTGGHPTLWIFAATRTSPTGTPPHGALTFRGSPDHGLFTRYLLDALDPDPPAGLDANGDGGISWSEVSNFVRRYVKIQSELEGRLQIPVVYHEGSERAPAHLPDDAPWLVNDHPLRQPTLNGAGDANHTVDAVRH